MLQQQEELFQEILFEIWKSLKKFENRSSVKTYVYRIAHNVAFRHINKQSRIEKFKSVPPDDLLSATPEHDYHNRQQLDLLTLAIRQLAVNQREIVSLSLEGLTYPEISEIAGISESNVGVILNRSKRRIKQIMENNK